MPLFFSHHLKVSREEAQETVNLWYNDRQEVRKWQELRKKEAIKDGYVLTLLGRARRFPAYQSRAQKNHIQRAAINTPVQVFHFVPFDLSEYWFPFAISPISTLSIDDPHLQGSAADVAMCAMLEITTNQQLKELGWKLLLQVTNEEYKLWFCTLF